MYKWFICLHYLRRRKIIFFSVLGLIIGILVMIAVTSVMGGFSRELRERIRGIASHLVVTRPGVPLQRADAILERIRRIPHVVAAAPHVEGYCYVIRQGVLYNTGAQFIGIDPAREVGDGASPGVSVLGRYLAEGAPRTLPPGDGASPPGLWVGDDILQTEKRRCEPGDRLTLVTIPERLDAPGDGLGSSKHTAPDAPEGGLRAFRQKTFAVAGTFHSNMNEYDRGLVYMPLKAAQDFLGLGDAVTHLAVRLDDYARAAEVKRAIRDALDDDPDLRDVTRGLAYMTWEEVAGKRILLDAVNIEKNMQAVILFIIVLVAGFNVIAILTLIVDLKTRDIGILRSLGATARGISGLFLLNGALIGAIGSAVGVALGLAVAYSLDPLVKGVHRLTGFQLFPPTIYYLGAVPAEVNLPTIATIAAASLLVSLAFSAYPAWKAARLNPIEAIRHE
jgi:lipoprotein-releasing system permease protein